MCKDYLTPRYLTTVIKYIYHADPLGYYHKHKWNFHYENVFSSNETAVLENNFNFKRSFDKQLLWVLIWSVIYFLGEGNRNKKVELYPKTIFMIDENVKMINVKNQSRSDESD